MIAGVQVVYRPKRIRWVAGIAAIAVVVLFTLASFGLRGSTGFENSGRFERGDQAAMIGLGVLIGLGILAFTRPRVTADDDGIKIRNVVGGYDLPWSVVRAVRFDRKSPWATLELYDDDQVSLHALQAADKEYAIEGVRTLRALHSARLSSLRSDGLAPQ
jgi:Bacterial PH domain